MVILIIPLATKPPERSHHLAGHPLAGHPLAGHIWWATYGVFPSSGGPSSGGPSFVAGHHSWRAIIRGGPPSVVGGAVLWQIDAFEAVGPSSRDWVATLAYGIELRVRMVHTPNVTDMSLMSLSDGINSCLCFGLQSPKRDYVPDRPKSTLFAMHLAEDTVKWSGPPVRDSSKST